MSVPEIRTDDVVHSVTDRRRDWIGPWRTEPLVYLALTSADVGRTVIYRDHGRAEAGTLTSWKNGLVFARYGRGDTSAGARAEDLVFGVECLSHLSHPGPIPPVP